LEKSPSQMNVRAQKEFGGSAGSTNEEPVSSVGARRPPDDAVVRKAAAPLQPPKASGRDHPAESEHDHEHQKLHGESDRRLRRQAEHKDES